MFNGADNFYQSDKLTQKKETFKNQYQMTVIGNLFMPEGMDQDAKKIGNCHWPPNGSSKRAKLKPLCTEIGGTRGCNAGD